MAAKSPYPVLAAIPRLSRKRPIYKCTCPNAPRRVASSLFRYFHTSPQLQNEINSETQPISRWKQTPPAMKAPVPASATFRPRVVFRVNEDPQLLDEVYIRVLGDRGDKMLTEEVKWLAVTHKSFDHGRRGYNDRLAFLGTRSRSWVTGIVADFQFLQVRG